jgi:hypothetical protein
VTPWPGPASALLVAWAIARLAPAKALPRVAGTLLLAPLAAGGWLMALALVDVRWTEALVLLTLLVVPLSILLHPPRLPRLPDPWAAVAAVAALGHAGLVAVVPAFGWDFRYIWGLKARAFAATGGHDATWLAWPGHVFAHPTYPPLWSDLLAQGATFGAQVAASAAVWGALLVVALAATCWWAAGETPPPIRAVAAIVGAWAPTIFFPGYSGYAEPLLALFAAGALGALARLAPGRDDAAPMLMLSVAGLALTKQEGMALAAAALVAAMTIAGWRRTASVALPAAVATACWWIFLAVHGIGVAEYRAGTAAVVRHLVELPSAVAAAIGPGAAAVVASWLLVAFTLRVRAVRLALALWIVAVLIAYLTTSATLAWHLANSLDRVLAAPLPGAVAVALGGAWRLAVARSSALLSDPRLRLDSRAARL